MEKRHERPSALSMTLILHVLHDVQKMLLDAEMATLGLDDKTLPVKGESGEPAKSAQLSRDLLHLADQLGLAAALVRNEYWAVKGRASYDID